MADVLARPPSSSRLAANNDVNLVSVIESGLLAPQMPVGKAADRSLPWVRSV